MITYILRLGPALGDNPVISHNVKNETILEIKAPIFNSPATTLSKYVISWMASYEMLPSCFSSTVSISLRRTSCMSGLIANSYRQNVMVVDDVSNPAMKNTKACAAKQFMDIPTHNPFSLIELNQQIKLKM